MIGPTAALVVYDLEYTAWEGSRERGWSGPGEHREVVHIGAVRLDPTDGLSVLATFEAMVRPLVNPILSAYFTQLTGIDQARLDREGIGLALALQRLAAFADGAALASNGDDAAVLRESCRLSGLPYPFAGRTIDIGPLFRRTANRDQHILSCRLPEVFGITPDGNAVPHDALGDARQVAAALRHLVDKGLATLAELFPS
jgi:inhibitor of KinA sporulation pathway (predicted exonuclease)